MEHVPSDGVRPPRVRRLPPELVNQIAAGEVVERPASVVKELAENSVDAGARRIDVEADGGGLLRLRVVDDGFGMTPDEMRLALERHATSKLASADDLWRLRTLGFRGEALPSIASVSRMTLVSRTPDAGAAHRILLEGGAVREEAPAGAPVGTQVDVRDLFFNVPARRKFQRSEQTEGGQIHDVLLGLALAHPALHVRLVLAGRVALDLPPHPDLATRARAALGRRGADLFVAEGEEAGVRVVALLTPPELSLPSARGLHLLVNRRAVRDRSLGVQVALGFGEILARGRYPAGVLLVEVPDGRVDVNVHPQKAEVRFASPEEVHAAVRHVIATVVARAPWMGGRAAAPPARRVVLAPRPAVTDAAPAEAPNRARAGELLALFARVPRAAEAPETASARPPRIGLGSASQADTASFLSSLEYIGQALGTYLVCESPGALVLIDQHAAHERVAFERLRRALDQGRAHSQPLLTPLVVDLAPREEAAAREGAALLASIGLDLASLDGRAWALRAVPALLVNADPAALLRDVLADLAADQGVRSAEDRIDHVLATAACHGVVRAGDRLGETEARALIAALDGIDHHGSCPHGRPVLLTMPQGEIERRFGRA